MTLRSKLFVGRRAEIEAVFRGFRRALDEETIVRPHPWPTWDPTPGAPFPRDTISSFDDAPGEVVDASSLTLEILDMAMRRAPDLVRAQAVLVGPRERYVYVVPQHVVEGVLAWEAPLAELDERLIWFSSKWGNTYEHGDERDVDVARYFDRPLKAVRPRGWTPHEAAGTPPEPFVARIAALARGLAPGQEIFFLGWLTAEPIRCELPGQTIDELRDALRGSAAPPIKRADVRAMRAALPPSPRMVVKEHPVVVAVHAFDSKRERARITRTSDKVWHGVIDRVERFDGPLDALMARVAAPRAPLEPGHLDALCDAFCMFPSAVVLHDGFGAMVTRSGLEDTVASFIRVGDGWFMALEREDHRGELPALLEEARRAWPQLT